MQVSVLGCGWLGHEVAIGLINKGYSIKGSTTTPAKLSVLQSEGITPYPINLENPEPEAITGFLQDSEVLIINIPPRLKDSAVSYPDKMRALVPYIAQAGITKVLFTSSTSVYADAFPFPVITEETPPNPQTESGRQIIEAEQVLQNNTAFTTTILRLSGLYGGLRHPVYHLAGRVDVDNPLAPINLVGLDTASRVIYGILQHNAWGDVFLVAERKHISREAYYTQKAKGLGLEPPQFNHTQRSVGKIILADKVESLMDFRN